MKSFKSFVVETRMTTVKQLTDTIAAHIRAGVIVNSVYKDLYKQARRLFSKDTEAVRDLIISHFHAGNRTKELSDLYYQWPYDSFTSLAKSARMADEINDPKVNDVVAGVKHVVSVWMPIINDLNRLKNNVVTVAQKRAEANAAASQASSHKIADSSPLIKILESHMAEYVRIARDRAKEFVDSQLDILKNNQWNLDKVAPRPTSRMSINQHKLMRERRALFNQFVDVVSQTPTIVQPNHTKIAQYINNNASGAEDAYRKFIAKMVEKIGKPVIDASMTGNIWTNATLTVITNDGQQQVWNTKMIVNFSKYRRQFNQFPTRRKK